MGLVNVIDVKGEIDDHSAITFAAELYAQLASLGASAMQHAFMLASCMCADVHAGTRECMHACV